LRKLDITLAEHPKPERAAKWISEVLSTVTSNAFNKFTIRFPPVYTAKKNQARRWDLVNDVLDRFSPCVDVSLVMTAQDRGKTEDLVKKYFPLMWEKGKVDLVLSG